MQLIEVNTNKGAETPENDLSQTIDFDFPPADLLEPEVAVELFELEDVSSEHFITSNTEPILLQDLSGRCIIPVFSKDNESTISHQEFINTVAEIGSAFFSGQRMLKPAIRVSHPIKGRVPEAMGRPVQFLQESDKTVYWERMAFMIEFPEISELINGNRLSLTIGGVRSYNLENLYSRKIEEHFKVFIGFKNLVCCNLCISTDGIKKEIRVKSLAELALEVYQLFADFKIERELNNLHQLGDYYLSEKQFAQLVGRSRMYQYLPPAQKKLIMPIPINDSQISSIAREYYQDKSFSRSANGDIDLWKLYNLFTGANKTSYIDTFLDRGAGCTNFIQSIGSHLESGTTSWYLS
jgi:Domain of unknown function, B. Theta Gene description (DUF3871)